MVDCCTHWSKCGNSNASWWLGWYYEGTNHQKSVWYYIAALRQNPDLHSWAFERVYGDAHKPGMCAGFEVPSLDFLSYIVEFHQYEHQFDVTSIKWGNWREAVDIAEAVVDKSAPANFVKTDKFIDLSAGCVQ